MMDKISDESFIRLEKLCEGTIDTTLKDENLLENVDIPKLDDTLEEVDFILSLGLKLKDEGKIKFATPPSRVPFAVLADKRNLNVQLNVKAHSSPETKHLLSNVPQQRLSNLISPIEQAGKSPITTCRSNFASQVICPMSVSNFKFKQ